MDIVSRKVQEDEIWKWREQLHQHYIRKKAELIHDNHITWNNITKTVLNTSKDFLYRASLSRSEPVNRCKNLKTQVEKLKEQYDNVVEANKNIINENNAISESITKLIQELEKAHQNKDNLKKDKELFTQELIKTHKAFTTAKTYYKSHLAIYYAKDERSDEENTVVHVEFFTKRKKNINAVTISRNKANNQYTLLEMNPKLSIFDELAARLHKTGDILGFLCCVRACFIQIGNTSSNKKS